MNPPCSAVQGSARWWVAAVAASVALGSLLVPIRATPGVVSFGSGAPTASLIVEALGHVPREVEVHRFAPGGPERLWMPWEAFASALERMAAGNAPPRREATDSGPVPATACGVYLSAWQVAGSYCGPDAGQGSGPGGPFGYCDDSSAWIVYRGAPPGSSFIVLKRGSGPVPWLCCGFGFGCWSWWDEVEMSAAKEPRVLAGLEYEGCFADAWTLHSDGYCPNPFPIAGGSGPASGALDSFVLHFRAKGMGNVLSFRFGNGLTFDYFAGLGATVCYDLPPGVQVQSVACPEGELLPPLE